MDGMAAVRLERLPVAELHYSAEFVALRSRRDVLSDPGFDEAGNLTLQLPDFCNHVMFLLGGHSRFPAKGEGMDEHANHSRVKSGSVHLGFPAGQRGWKFQRKEIPSVADLLLGADRFIEIRRTDWW